MEYKAIFWIFCNLLSIVVLAFYSMLEMACVSFNKVRLQYYVSKGMKRAIWINDLLQNPAKLFGTTLIGVNIALVIGSECSRQFHSAIGINPDLAPISQVVIVVIFGELAPMFAARHYTENVAMIGVPIIYASSKLMAPLLLAVGWISKMCNLIVSGREVEGNIYLTQEELQKILEEQEEDQPHERESEEFNAITSNIFSLRAKEVRQIMEPLSNISLLPSNATVAQMEELLQKNPTDYVPVYHQSLSNIVGIASPRDLIRVPETKRIRDYARPPWFVTENTTVMQILKQFKTNNEYVAVILNQHGKALGIINFDDVLEELFGKSHLRDKQQDKQQIIIEKTLSGEMKVKEFNRQFGVILDKDEELTLSQLISNQLGGHLEKGDSIYIAPYEFTVKEMTLLEVKSIMVTTRRK